MKELYEDVNPLCLGGRGVRTSPKAFSDSEPLFAFRRQQLHDRSDCDSDQSHSEDSDLYSLSESDSESLSLGTFRSQLLSEN